MNGETDKTRGLSMRELLLEVRSDQKTHIENGHSDSVSWRGLFATLIGIGGIILGIIVL